jgi:hypothetical protein
VKMNRDGKCKSVMLYYFFNSVANTPRKYTIGSKFLNLREVLFRVIIFYIVCVFGRDIVRQKFCKYGWDNLFWKSSVKKEYWCKILVVSNSDRK